MLNELHKHFNYDFFFGKSSHLKNDLCLLSIIGESIDAKLKYNTYYRFGSGQFVVSISQNSKQMNQLNN